MKSIKVIPRKLSSGELFALREAALKESQRLARTPLPRKDVVISDKTRQVRKSGWMPISLRGSKKFTTDQEIANERQRIRWLESL